MIRYDKYLWYVLKHKWFVIIECFKVGLFFRGLMHDNDKFLISMIIPYTKKFYSKDDSDITTCRDKTGYYNPMLNSDDDFKIAILKHFHKNRHHWQHWILPTTLNEEKYIAFPMSKIDVMEMLCDWKGASKAQGNKNYSIKEWFDINEKNMILHPDSKKIIIELLNKE